MPSNKIPEPWKSFLSELDKELQTVVVLHCLGGFALSLIYGLPRPTVDIDICEVAPGEAKTELIARGGKGSALQKKHGVYLQIVTMASVPHDYESRLDDAFKTSFQKLRLFVLEAHDLALSKLGRNLEVDMEDVKYLAATVPLNLELLRARYLNEVRPYLIGPAERGDTTIDLWCDAINEQRLNTTTKN